MFKLSTGFWFLVCWRASNVWAKNLYYTEVPIYIHAVAHIPAAATATVGGRLLKTAGGDRGTSLGSLRS